jgi:hypothetical protein
VDPDATLKIIGDKTLSKKERNYACADLKHWLDYGGFLPDWSTNDEAEYYYHRWLDQGRAQGR